MADSTQPTRNTAELPGEAGYPEEAGTLSQDAIALIDDVIDNAHAAAFGFDLVNDEKTGSYTAVVGVSEIAGLPYQVASRDRLVLLATSVFPEFRKQGIATELIRRVLDDVRTQRKTVTVRCPIVRIFIERNPEYADLIDPKHPGVATRPHQS